MSPDDLARIVPKWFTTTVSIAKRAPRREMRQSESYLLEHPR
jgi:hypothetical protein